MIYVFIPTDDAPRGGDTINAECVEVDVPKAGGIYGKRMMEVARDYADLAGEPVTCYRLAPVSERFTGVNPRSWEDGIWGE